MNAIVRLFRSYHFRNMVVATLLSGTVLVAITIVYARTVRLAERTQLDIEIRELALIHLTQPFRPVEQWQQLDEQLRQDTPERITPPMILVRGGQGEVIYCTPEWRIAPDAREVLNIREIRDRFESYRKKQGLPQLPPPGQRPTLVPPPPPTLKYHNWTDESGKQWRIGITGTPGLTLAIARDWTQRKSGYSRMVNTFVATLPLLLLALAGISYSVSHRALRPIRELQATAERITVHGLDERIDAEDVDTEFEGLIQVFNGMLDRLERSFRIANEFSAAAAHELKTPLAVLQGEIERGVQESPPGSEEQARYSRLSEQVQRLKTITHKLLLLAAVDAQGLRLNAETFDLSECVLDACEDSAIIAPAITQEKSIPPRILLQADPELMPHVVTNLIINAVIHNHADGHIGVRLEETPATVTLTVSNTGPGIPPEDSARVFRRFYRTDKSRTRNSGGSGLGLSLAREIARAHGGDIDLVQSSPVETTFRLTLPKDTPAP